MLTTSLRLETAARDDPDPRVRAAALGALARAAPDARESCGRSRRPTTPRPFAAAPPSSRPLLATDADTRVSRLLDLLADRDVTVVEAAAWALGELGAVAVAGGAVDALADVVAHHRDALAREAAVAALGALGDPAGLPAILGACSDKPAVRRRAVLALAPFDGPKRRRRDRSRAHRPRLAGPPGRRRPAP